jgi:hypothetical protein
MISVSAGDFRRWREEAQKGIDDRLEELSKQPRISDLGYGVGMNWDAYFAKRVNEHFGVSEC